MMPSLFIAHGAPLLAIEDNEYTQFLRQLGENLPRPKAVVLFSAHYESSTQQVGTVAGAYDTIYDFGGFPRALYEITYPAKGEPEVAQRVRQLLEGVGVAVQTNHQRGLDHGAWVILRLLYPDADVPVVSMSVDPSLPPSAQYDIGKALSSLREEGILVIGSGGTVHNLRTIQMSDEGGQPEGWALDFDNWLEQHLKAWDLASLYDYEELAPGARMAVPPYGNEHFIPIFYAMGAADDSRQAGLLHRTYRYGTLSHSVWQFS